MFDLLGAHLELLIKHTVNIKESKVRFRRDASMAGPDKLMIP